MELIDRKGFFFVLQTWERDGSMCMSGVFFIMYLFFVLNGGFFLSECAAGDARLKSRWVGGGYRN